MKNFAEFIYQPYYLFRKGKKKEGIYTYIYDLAFRSSGSFAVLQSIAYIDAASIFKIKFAMCDI